jgi:gamma-glutamylcyclotransferase (GGCT)/AIG2-like uncharacterized protein YtfP
MQPGVQSLAQDAVANDLIMFYGSLQRGEPPYDKLNLAQMLDFVQDCTFRGDLRDMGWYPACVRGNAIIHGGIYRIRDAGVVDVLDEFERYNPADPEGSLYLRIKIRLLSPDLEAWTYIYNQDVTGRPVVESGHWLRHKRERDSPSDAGGT